MKTVLLLLGIVALIAGMLFALQGMGIASLPRTSFMANSTEWVLYGLVLAGLGLVLVGMSMRR